MAETTQTARPDGTQKVPAPAKMQKARKLRRPVDPNETERAKFLRLANRRIPVAIKAIERLGNLGNRKVYEYTESEAEKIMQWIMKAVRSLQDRFTGTREAEQAYNL